MNVSDLKDGQVVRARWGRAGKEDVDWGSWRDVELYVQMFVNKKTKEPEICAVALRNWTWAEYGPRDFIEAKDAYQNGVRGAPNGVFLVEDYYLEIEGLTKREGSRGQ
jgi:hypothetical protein